MLTLRLQHRSASGPVAVEVRLPDDAPVSDLLRLLGAPHATVLHTPAGPVPADQPVRSAGLLDGDEVATARGSPPRDAAEELCPDPPGPALVVVAGPCAGRRVPLTAGVHVVGRDPRCDVVLDDPTVSAAHARIVVGPGGDARVDDLGSRNGTAADGRTPAPQIAFGTARCHVVAAPPRRAPRPVPDTGGRVTRASPPRTRLPPQAPLPPLPRPAHVAAPTTSVGAASLLVPLVLGAVLGLVFTPVLALFALLGPAVTGGQWLDERRRYRRDRRAAERRFAADVRTFAIRLRRWRDDAVAHAREATPDPAALTALVATADARCWERRRGDADHLRLRVGASAGSLAPPLAPGARVPPPVGALLRALERVADVPVTVTLVPGEDLTVVGGDGPALPVLRALVLQAAVLHAPSGLAVAVISDQPERWHTVAWLPHARGSGDALVGGPDEADRMIAALGDRPALLLIDGVPPRAVRAVGDAAVARLCRVVSPEDVPDRPGWVLDLTAGPSGVVLRRSDAGEGRWLVPDGTPDDVLRAVGRVLARWREPADRAADVPATDVDLVGVLGTPAEPEAIRGRWRRADGRVATPIGRRDDGVAVLDLGTDGPHALVAGTTGSGKSELLRSLVLGLAVSCPPDQLGFLLFDFKGGSTFDGCRRLPHTTDVLTDLDGTAAARALECLRAEVRRREEILRDAGAGDLAALRRGGGDLHALVVVVDEFAVLAEDHPDVLHALIDVARRGRSLGVHLVLATQRPAGTVTADVRANTSLRIVLRVEDPADATDVIGDATPATFPRSAAGRALVRIGGGASFVMQTARVGHGTGPSIRPLAAPAPSPTATDAAAAVADIVDACRIAAVQAAVAPAPSVLPPPLPEDLDAADLPPATTTSIPLGLVDRPALQRREVLWWAPADGPLLAVGRDACAGPLAAAAAVVSGLPPHRMHVQVIAAGSGIGALADAPHTGSVIHPRERDRLARLLHHLRSAPPVPVLLVVTDLPAVLRRLDAPADAATREQLTGLLLEGHERGVHVAAGVPNPAGVPAHVLPPGAVVVVGAGVGRSDARTLGVGGVPAAPPNARRVTVGAAGDEVQLARGGDPADGWALAAEGRGPAPFRAAATPDAVVLGDDLLAASRVDGDVWSLAIARHHDDLRPAVLELAPGGSALIAGPARSGRSTLLATIATVVRRLAPDLPVTALGAGLTVDVPGVGHARTVDEAFARHRDPGPGLLLIDDAERFADAVELEAVVGGDQPLRVVAAGRNDRLRVTYHGWLAELRRQPTGVALAANPDADGAIWDVVLPRRHGEHAAAGRAELVRGGTAEHVLVASP